MNSIINLNSIIFQIEFYLPPFKTFKRTVERLTSMDQFTILHAEMEATKCASLQMTVETTPIEVANHFYNLELSKTNTNLNTSVVNVIPNHNHNHNHNHNEHSQESVSVQNSHPTDGDSSTTQITVPIQVKIDIKKLNVFLNNVMIKPSLVKCSLKNADAVLFYFYHDFVAFKVYIRHCNI